MQIFASLLVDILIHERNSGRIFDETVAYALLSLQPIEFAVRVLRSLFRRIITEVKNTFEDSGNPKAKEFQDNIASRFAVIPERINSQNNLIQFFSIVENFIFTPLHIEEEESKPEGIKRLAQKFSLGSPTEAAVLGVYRNTNGEWEDLPLCLDIVETLELVCAKMGSTSPLEDDDVTRMLFRLRLQILEQSGSTARDRKMIQKVLADYSKHLQDLLGREPKAERLNPKVAYTLLHCFQALRYRIFRLSIRSGSNEIAQMVVPLVSSLLRQHKAAVMNALKDSANSDWVNSIIGSSYSEIFTSFLPFNPNWETSVTAFESAAASLEADEASRAVSVAKDRRKEIKRIQSQLEQTTTSLEKQRENFQAEGNQIKETMVSQEHRRRQVAFQDRQEELEVIQVTVCLSLNKRISGMNWFTPQKIPEDLGEIPMKKVSFPRVVDISTLEVGQDRNLLSNASEAETKLSLQRSSRSCFLRLQITSRASKTNRSTFAFRSHSCSCRRTFRGQRRVFGRR